MSSAFLHVSETADSESLAERWAQELTRAEQLERLLAKAEREAADWQFIALSNGEQLAKAQVELAQEREAFRIRDRDNARHRVLEQRAENDRLAERLDAALEREVAAYDRANEIARERDALLQTVNKLTEERDRSRRQFGEAIAKFGLVQKWCAANLDAEQMADLLADPIGRDCSTCEGSGGGHCHRRDEWVDCEAGCFGGRNWR